MKYGYEDGWFVEFEDAARWFLGSDAAQGEAMGVLDEDGMDGCVLQTAVPTSEEVEKRAAALGAVLDDIIADFKPSA